MRKIGLIFLFAILSHLIAISQPFGTKLEWEEYFKSRIKDIDVIEGIWSNSMTWKIFDKFNSLIETREIPHSANVVVYKVDNMYKTSIFGDDGDTSSYRISFINTASVGIYIADFKLKNSSSSKSNVILTGGGLLRFSIQAPIDEYRELFPPNKQKLLNELKIIIEHQWLKLYPVKIDAEKSNPKSGTGFGITSNGLIVTNFHVIDEAKSIKVRGVGLEFNKTYKANVLVADPNNDLALLQVDDNDFSNFSPIPYTIKSSLAEVGESIFVLGYPLRATMGNEIKLTNGIISSRTGFQGNVSSYQISAPVQPGNSGGPLFDSQGNLIGVINSKHGGAENASYAVKASYLMNLIDLLPNPPNLQTVNSLFGKTLMQQVELAKQHVFIIETE